MLYPISHANLDPSKWASPISNMSSMRQLISGVSSHETGKYLYGLPSEEFHWLHRHEWGYVCVFVSIYVDKHAWNYAYMYACVYA